MSKTRVKPRPKAKEFAILAADLMQEMLNSRPNDLYKFGVEYFQKKIRAEKLARSVSIKINKDSDDENSYVSVDLTKRYRHETVCERFTSSMTTKEITIYPKRASQIDLLKQITPGIFLFKGLDNASIDLLINAMVERQVLEGDEIIKQGDPGDYFYIVERGEFKAYLENEESATSILKTTYTKEGYFGELALMHSTARACTVIAATDGFLWALDRDTFREVIYQTATTKRSKLLEIMDKISMLKNIEPYDKLQLADAFQVVRFEENDIIIREGDDPDGLYFIDKGSVSVSVYDDEQMNFIEVTHLCEGEYFGELALIEPNRKRESRTTALETTYVAFLDESAFHRLLENICLVTLKKSASMFLMKVKSQLGLDL